MPQLSRNTPTNSSGTAFRPPRPVGTKNSVSFTSGRDKTTNEHVEISSFSSGSEQDNELDNKEHRQAEGITNKRPRAATTEGSNQTQPAIPRNLLVRLLHEHFRSDDTRITEEGMSLFASYIEIFVKEAIHRAIEERRSEDRATTNNHFLEVEDLEKLVPQLLLDF